MTADELAETLGMQPHPEGGRYVETWRGPEVGGRATATAIYFLLVAGERSHWHRVDADEIWLFHAGDPLVLEIAGSTDSGGSAESAGWAWSSGSSGSAWSAESSGSAWSSGSSGSAIERHILGSSAALGERPQVVVPAGAWQSASPIGDWTLVSCVVAPGFVFDGFELAPAGWTP